MFRDALIFAAVIAADRLTKFMVPEFMDLHRPVEVIPGFFSLTYIRNTGGAFGILSSWDSPMRRVFFIGASIAAIVLLIYLYGQALAASCRRLRLSFALIGGGAFGNLYDRALSGEVIDFLDLFIGRWHWPAFNIADLAISLGAALLAYLYITGQADVVAGKQDTDVP